MAFETIRTSHRGPLEVTEQAEVTPSGCPLRHRHDGAAALEVPDDISDRLTFLLKIGPKPQEPSTYGVALNYELYSIVTRLTSPGEWPVNLAEHFIHGMPATVDRPSAELGFYQEIHGTDSLIFREDKGGDTSP